MSSGHSGVRGGSGFGAYGYGGFGYGGLGYGGYGYGYGGYGYNTPSYNNYSYSTPYYGGYTYPATPTVVGNPVMQAGGFEVGNSVSQAGGISSSTGTTTPTPALVTIVVPEGAEVWFDGKLDAGNGTSRVFVSPALKPGQSTTLSVKAKWGGSTRELNLPIQAGDKMSVDISKY